MTYDGSFEGFLSLIYESYTKKIVPEDIFPLEEKQQDIFATYEEVHTDEKKARRVWEGLYNKKTAWGARSVYMVFLSEMKGVEMLLFRYVQKIFAFPGKFEYNFSDEDVLRVEKIRRRISREAHRMLMFVRFQKTADGMYYAAIEPRYNVLSLVLKHFANRYAKERWMLYDMKRKYGFYSDGKEIIRVTTGDDFAGNRTVWLPRKLLHEEEIMFRTMWKEYFQALSIEERKNPRLQMQLLPKRFWKYLPEKQDFDIGSSR